MLYLWYWVICQANTCPHEAGRSGTGCLSRTNDFKVDRSVCWEPPGDLRSRGRWRFLDSAQVLGTLPTPSPRAFSHSLGVAGGSWGGHSVPSTFGKTRASEVR